MVEGFENLVGVNFWTALFGFCNMLITFAWLKKFLFKPVKKMMDNRREEIDGLYANAAQEKAQAEALQVQYAAQLKEAAGERERMMQAAVRNAHAQEEAILQEARQKASHTMAQAQVQIALAEKQAVNALKDQLSGMAVDIAAAVLEAEIDRKKHAKLIDGFVRKLGEST